MTNAQELFDLLKDLQTQGTNLSEVSISTLRQLNYPIRGEVTEVVFDLANSRLLLSADGTEHYATEEERDLLNW